MGGASKIRRLDPAVREQIDRLIRNGHTINQITDHLALLLDEAAPARSSVGRYVQNARKQMEKYQQAQDLARVWVNRIEEEPDGDVGRLLSEMLRTVAYQAIGTLDESDDGVRPGDVMMLARAIKDLSSADKTRADQVLKIRKELMAKAAASIERVAGKRGLSEETIQELRRDILGMS